jgi:hypothetical protein
MNENDELNSLAHQTVGAVVGSGVLMRLLFPQVWKLACECWDRSRRPARNEQP